MQGKTARILKKLIIYFIKYMSDTVYKFGKSGISQMYWPLMFCKKLMTQGMIYSSVGSAAFPWKMIFDTMKLPQLVNYILKKNI
jgi:hypothetical protein